MPTTRLGLTVPAYTDIADGPGAFYTFVDNGTVPRFASFTALEAGWANPPHGSVAVLMADERYAIAPSPLNILIYDASGKWYTAVPRRWHMPAAAPVNVGNAGNTTVTVLSGSALVDDNAVLTIDGAIAIDLVHVNDATRDWTVKTEYSWDGGANWVPITNNTLRFFQNAPASAPGASAMPIGGQHLTGATSGEGKDALNTIQIRMTVQALRGIGPPEAQTVVAGTWLNVMTTVAGGWV